LTAPKFGTIHVGVGIVASKRSVRAIVIISKRSAIAKGSPVVIVGFAGGHIKRNIPSIQLNSSVGQSEEFFQLFQRFDFDISKSFRPSSATIHNDFTVFHFDLHMGQMLYGAADHSLEQLVLTDNAEGQVANVRRKRRFRGIVKYLGLSGRKMFGRMIHARRFFFLMVIVCLDGCGRGGVFGDCVF
jgi:hypothetical protein